MSLRSILFLVNAVALVVFAVVAVLAARKSSPPPPANLTDYYPDDVMEGPKLERYLGAAVLFSAVLAASLPLYWLLEPDRQERMNQDFDDDSVLRGKQRFAREGVEVEGVQAHSQIGRLACARCHGDTAEGGSASLVLPPDEPGGQSRTVSWTAPSLDDVLLRFSPEEVTQIIVYGRPGTPMPAWGLAGKGALPEQPIQDLVNYLKSIQITPEKAKERSAERAKDYQTKNPGSSEGQALFAVNCARCHTKGYSYGEPRQAGAGGAFGPNLTDGVTLRQFPALTGGVQKHIDFVTTGSDFQQQYGSQGIGSGRMPGFGQLLTAEQISKIVIYERGL